MSTDRIFEITIDGNVDQRTLEDLRTELGLSRRGRLTDDFDEEFGFRSLGETAAASADLRLYRMESGWQLIARSSDTPPEGAVDQWKAQAIDAVRRAGLDVLDDSHTFEGEAR